MRPKSQWLILLVVLILLAALVPPFITHFLLGPADAARVDGIRRLADAASLEELKEAVGPLGVVLRLRDNSWVAIYYRDSHGNRPWSQAVALDSAGNWYECQTHFCGYLEPIRGNPQSRERLEFYERIYRPNDRPLRLEDNLPVFIAHHILKIEEAQHLEAAQPHLAALGFTPMEVSRTPQLRGPLPAE